MADLVAKKAELFDVGEEMNALQVEINALPQVKKLSELRAKHAQLLEDIRSNKED